MESYALFMGVTYFNLLGKSFGIINFIARYMLKKKSYKDIKVDILKKVNSSKILDRT